MSEPPVISRIGTDTVGDPAPECENMKVPSEATPEVQTAPFTGLWYEMPAEPLATAAVRPLMVSTRENCAGFCMTLVNNPAPLMLLAIVKARPTAERSTK